MKVEFPSELAVYLADSVRAARRRYRTRLARCQERFSEKAVHELRIETRRVLAMIDLLRTLHFGDALDRTRKGFKKRLDAFDDLRDTHVQLGLLKPFWREFPESLQLRVLLRRRERRLVEQLRSGIKAMRSKRFNRRLKQIEKALRRCGRARTPTIGTASAEAALRQAFARVVRLRRLARRSRTATLHRLRVAFKRYRYMTELLQPFLFQRTLPLLDRMKQYQAMAGDIQDLEVLLARVADAVKDGALTPAEVRHLRRELLRRRRRAIDAFMAKADDVFEFQPEDSRQVPGS